MNYTVEQVKQMTDILKKHGFSSEEKETNLERVNSNNVYHPDFLFGIIRYIGILKQNSSQDEVLALENLVVDLVDNSAITVDVENDNYGLKPFELAQIINSDRIISSISKRLNKNIIQTKTFTK